MELQQLKKSALAVFALSSTAVFAGTMGPVCSPTNVTVPCEEKLWDIGGRALYVQPTSTTFVANRTLTGSQGSVDVGLSPSWSWGFQLEASHHFNTGNDLNLNWYHFRGSDSLNIAPNQNIGQFKAPYDPVTPGNTVGNPTTINSVNASIYNDWDQVNIEFGQHVDFGANKFVRLHAGAQFARVASDANVTSTITAPTTPVTTNAVITGVYNGFGPRVGVDLDYGFGNGFDIYGTAGVGALAGSSKTNYNESLATSTGSYITNYNDPRIVPTVDAKLGAMYTYSLAQGDLSFDAGWLWNEYVGAIESAGSSTGAHNNNFGIQGLYFGMKWVGGMMF
ncbi:MAG: hypothetical protein EBQ95_03300 [Gammaproteobacteria bacterium]|nr:hypothetical protein [Gammaproteobacteria bacterium]